MHIGIHGNHLIQLPCIPIYMPIICVWAYPRKVTFIAMYIGMHGNQIEPLLCIPIYTSTVFGAYMNMHGNYALK